MIKEGKKGIPEVDGWSIRKEGFYDDDTFSTSEVYVSKRGEIFGKEWKVLGHDFNDTPYSFTVNKFVGRI